MENPRSMSILRIKNIFSLINLINLLSFGCISLKYDYYLEKPEALETYNKIVNSIIKENAEKLIKYEKIYLIYNENFLEINKKLNII